MKKDDRTAIIDLAEVLIIIIILGATLGALYEAPWELYFKVIVFGFLFLLGLILNHVAKIGNINLKSLDSLLLIFIQLNLMGKKDGVKLDQASKTLEELEDATISKMNTQRKLFGDFDFIIIAIFVALIGVAAFVTTLII
jgi:hypothetical protein|tara:strand:- start:1505 stop:1924 length:420 start_codon:yes stop_codon:yes gene_type:complete